MFVKCHFLLYMESKKIKINKSIWRKYRKVFENLLTNRERSAILCTEKPRTKLKFGYFSLGSTV